MMSVQAFAERLLFGDRLEDKLSRPGPVRDSDMAAPLGEVDAPGRPPGLQFRKGGSFPRPDELSTDEGRGRALHAFANHELLAIELMALALLRFPDADPVFRTDIIRTIAEEQRHLRRYVHRMGELGVRFGDLPVNDWFWTHLSGMQTPTDYVVRMSLLFEQANLDFAGWYRDRFREIGDTATADVLHSVYLDEIRHVATGARWFEAWRDRERSPYHTWASLLPHPLSPVRARGIRFDADARRQAGLDEGFIRSLRRAKGSKGRQPVCWLPELDAEVHLEGRRSLPRSARELVADLQPAVGWLGHALDVVQVDRIPSDRWLRHCESLGHSLPTFAHATDLEQHAPYARVEGWARTLTASELARHLTTKAPAPLPQALFCKSAVLSLHDHLRQVGVPLTPAPLDPVLLQTGERPPWDLPTVLKPRFGSSGRGQRHLPPGATAPATGVASPRWPVRLEFSALLDTTRKQPVRRVMRPLIQRGTYRGHLLGSQMPLLSRQTKRALHEAGWLQAAQQAAQGAAEWLLLREYEGPASLDLAWVAPESGDALAVFELNPRWTMGQIALRLMGTLAPCSVGAWVHLPSKGAPLDTIASWTHHTDSMGRWRDGAWFPTDPWDARRRMTVAFAAESEDVLRERLMVLGLEDPSV